MGSYALVWDGKHVPEGLWDVPPGRYTLRRVERGPALTSAQDRGLSAALDQLDAGSGKPLSEVLAEIRRGARRK
ncbi:MAG: hypothetical protein HYY93_08515 [Planctomycetes bacterium]|nr:hypothetical protein [Planctomycetota bacterium]